MFKIIHELVDVQTDIIRTGDSKRRGSNRLYQPVAHKDVYKFSFFPRTIREWNLLPTSVTDADKLEDSGVGFRTCRNPSTHTSDQSSVHSFSIVYIPVNF